MVDKYTTVVAGDLERREPTLAKAREAVRILNGERDRDNGLIYLTTEWDAYQDACDAYEGDLFDPLARDKPRMPLPVEGVFWAWPGEDTDADDYYDRKLDPDKAKLYYEKLPR